MGKSGVWGGVLREGHGLLLTDAKTKKVQFSPKTLTPPVLADARSWEVTALANEVNVQLSLCLIPLLVNGLYCIFIPIGLD